MSCINTGATTAVVHRGKLIFTVYLCEGTDVTKKDEVNLMKEVVANGNPGFNWTQSDKVTDVRIVEEDSILRVDFTKEKEHFQIDMQLSDNVAKMRKINRFEDRSAFTLEQGQGVTNIRQM